MDDLSDDANEQTDLVAIILAAGMGTRMRSRLPKVLHHVAGDPIISHVLDAVAGAGIVRPLVVVGHGGDRVIAALGDSAQYVVQDPQLGTGHAVQRAVEALRPAPRRLLVLCGDAPLLTPSTISRLLDASSGATVTLLSAHLDDPSGYGRVVRDAGGRVAAIVEDADARGADRSLREVNSGAYCFDGGWVASNLGRLQKSPKGEYYLTDLVAMAVAQGREVRALVAEDATEVLGVNDRAQLAEADRLMRLRLCHRLMADGVTIVDPATTYVGKDVSVGADTILHPGTHLRGATTIGDRCEIGPNSVVVDSTIGDECVVLASVLEQCQVADRVSIGPFSHLRPGARIGSDARIGNYAEVKNSVIGQGVQVHHFSYLGDAEVGDDTNVGAGTITCNFDGRAKHRTRIGKGVFLGSDTLLRAPVELGDEARTGAGAVVTRNVPPRKLAVGMPARVREIRAEAESADTNVGQQGGREEVGS